MYVLLKKKEKENEPTTNVKQTTTTPLISATQIPKMCKSKQNEYNNRATSIPLLTFNLITGPHKAFLSILSEYLMTSIIITLPNKLQSKIGSAKRNSCYKFELNA